MRTSDIVKNVPHPVWDQAERSEVPILVLGCISQIGSSMADLDRIRVAWSGFIGAPGVSTFYATDAAVLIPQLRTFFDAIKSGLPLIVKIDIDNFGDTLNSDNGELIGSWVGAVQAQVVGTGAAAYSSLSGSLVQWKSDTVLSGRRLRGHTFLVPLATGCYDASGQLLAAVRVTELAAAAALVTASASNMLLFQRPRLAKPADGSRHAVTARLGGYGPVTGSSVRAALTSLRSRRD